ncbi:MAG: transglycosylase domain-containing protein [Synechocystis sp.]
MFNNLSRQLKQSTDRLRHQLADQADQTEGETPSPAADPDTQATTVTGNDRRSPRGPEIAPVQIRSLPNGGYEIINPATGKAVVLSRQGDADAPVAEGGVPNLDTMTDNSPVTEPEAESLATPLATAVVEKEEEETETLSPPEVTPAKPAGKPLPQRLSHAVGRIGQALYGMTCQPRFWLMLGFGLGGGVGTSALLWGFYQVEALTEVAIADVVTYAAPGTMTIKASNGKILQEIGNVSHDTVELGNIPPLVEQAFIASEDSRFREHRGIDLQGILRASVSNATSGEVVQGGSTITQQLARLVFLTQDRTFARKIKELRLAQKIETTLPKDQILERYLNLIYLGSGAYGVADASYTYFSKPPEDLTLGEAATLAGVVPAPSLYSPLENLEAATQRRNQVLTRMAEVGFISASEAQAAIAAPLTVNPSPLKRFNREAEFFTDYILQELKAKLPEDQRQAGGLTVNTTLNPDWQAEAQEILKKSVEKYGKWQRFSEGAMVSVDPRTGAIKMMVGGKDYNASQFNRVTQAKRQPGSTFKPILYAAAIAAGISPNKSYLDVPIEIGSYKPENYGDKYSGGNMSLRTALTGSVNVVAIRLLLDVGWNPVINLARNMGITSKLEPTYSIALGAWEMTPLEMTSAYGTFAKNGIHVQPYAIQNVVNAKGETIYKAEHQQTQALDPDSNAIMTSLMRSVVTSGTGRPAQLGDRQVAGKTGTSDEARDLWFIGYIPQLVTGVWIGNDNNQPTRGASTTAAMIWGEFMRDATKGMPVEYFPAMPKNPDARKPSIKAEPIKGRKVKVLAAPTTQAAPSSSPSRRRRSTASAPSRRRTASAPAPQRSSAASNPAPRHSAPPPTPQAAPAAPAGLPAPPAARKSE